MNKILKFFVYLSITVALGSCSGSQKVLVEGKPGTEIYSADTHLLGTIGGNGTTKVKISKKRYSPYLFSHEVSSDIYVPFAVDYKSTSSGSVFTAWVICNLTLVGTFPALLAAPFIDFSDQGNHSYKYLPYQQTNQDLMFANYKNTGPSRTVKGSYPTDVVQEVMESNQSSVSGTSAARSRSSKSAKTLNDFGKQVEGTYVGSGTLTQQDEVVERYSAMKVIVKRVDKNNVKIEVFEGNGEAFFQSGSEYSVKKAGDGGFTLSLKGISSAVISIDKNKKLSYCHPKVNIDGELYTLEISANKK